MSDRATSAGTGDGVNAESPARGMTSRRLLLYAVVLFLVWVVILGVWQGTFVRLLRMAGVLPPDLRPPFRVSAETTGITTPLDKYGWPDYVAAFNAEQSRGVTPETNFVVALREILGDREIPGGSAAAFDAALGLPQPITTKPLFRRDDEVLSRLTSEERTRVTTEDLAKAESGSWTAADFPLLAEWADANRPAFEALRLAARRRHHYQPLILPENAPFAFMVDVTFPLQMRSLHRLFIAQSMRSDIPTTRREQMEDCLVPVRIGRLVASPKTLIHVLIQHAFEGTTVRALSVWLARNDLAEADLNDLLTEWKSLPGRITAADAVESNEMWYFLDHLVQAARRREFPLEEFVDDQTVAPAVQRCVRYGRLDWDVALLEVQSHNRELARILGLERLADQTSALAKLRTKIHEQAQPWKSTWGGLARPFIGNPQTNARCLVATLCGESNTFGENSLRVDRRATARDRLLRLAIAVRRHQLQTRVWPTGLGEVAGVEAAGRVDPCVDGGELIYRATADGFVIYSVGNNGRDDRGENAETTPGSGADDIVIRVRLAPTPGQ